MSIFLKAKNEFRNNYFYSVCILLYFEVVEYSQAKIQAGTRADFFFFCRE